MTNCPNCESPYVLTGNKLNRSLTENATDFIHTFTKNISPAYCESCAKQAIPIAKQKALAKGKEIGAELTKHLHHIPMLSLQSPPNWKFTPLGLVTGQSVTGTGLFAEASSDWSDFFGMQSQAYNKKIAAGEVLCQSQLRAKCIQLGGNALLGVDIDYAEVGGAKGMLMVCMTATAVLLENVELLGADKAEALAIVSEIGAQQRSFNKFSGFLS